MNILRGITIFIIVGVLTKISYTDFKTKQIPDRWNLMLFALGIWSGFLFAEPPFSERAAGIFVVSVPLFLLALVLPGALGGGDVKLMAAGGMALGMKGILTATVLGMGAAGIYGLYLICSGRAGRKDNFALGPFLCAGMGIVLAPQFLLLWR